MNAFGLSRCVFVFAKSVAYSIMSALLYRLSVPHTHTAQWHYVRGMSLNSNQGKIIPSVVFFLKNFKSCTWTILHEILRKLAELVCSLLQYRALIGQSPLYSLWIMCVFTQCGFTEGMLFVPLHPPSIRALIIRHLSSKPVKCYCQSTICVMSHRQASENRLIWKRGYDLSGF